MNDATQAATRRQQITELVLEEVSRVVALSTELTAIRTAAWPIDADRVRAMVIAAAEGMAVTDLPRGYRVLGGTAKTPTYLQKSVGSKASDGEIITDVLTGWLQEIAEKQQATLDRLKKPEPKPRLVIDTRETSP